MCLCFMTRINVLYVQQDMVQPEIAGSRFEAPFDSTPLHLIDKPLSSSSVSIDVRLLVPSHYEIVLSRETLHI